MLLYYIYPNLNIMQLGSSQAIVSDSLNSFIYSISTRLVFIEIIAEIDHFKPVDDTFIII